MTKNIKLDVRIEFEENGTAPRVAIYSMYGEIDSGFLKLVRHMIGAVAAFMFHEIQESKEKIKML
jgi:hypothetical protein